MALNCKGEKLLLRSLITGFLLFGFLGCAITPTYELHSFSFWTTVEGQNAFVLDYRYGKRGSSRADSSALPVRPGQPLSQHGQSGPMLRGEELFVKWQDRKSGKVFEKLVDLRGKLPPDLTGCEVTFQLFGDEIFVYVVTAQKRDPVEPPIGPSSKRHRKVIQVYP